jgi:hypothetical protein
MSRYCVGDGWDWRCALRAIQTLPNTAASAAAASNNAAAVQALMGLWLNREGKLAVELTTDASFRTDLVKDTALPPQRAAMRWYGS